jgi:hypothetical protein
LDEIGKEDEIRDLKVKGNLISEYGFVKRRRCTDERVGRNIFAPDKSCD